jgi:hypothetical protein
MALGGSFPFQLDKDAILVASRGARAIMSSAREVNRQIPASTVLPLRSHCDEISIPSLQSIISFSSLQRPASSTPSTLFALLASFCKQSKLVVSDRRLSSHPACRLLSSPTYHTKSSSGSARQHPGTTLFFRKSRACCSSHSSVIVRP